MTAIFDDQERLVKKVNIGLAYERDSRNDAIQVPLEDFESVLFPCPARAKGLGPKMADGKGRVVWQWRVGSNTTPEEWPIIVSCSKGEERRQLRTAFAPRRRALEWRPTTSTSPTSAVRRTHAARSRSWPLAATTC